MKAFSFVASVFAVALSDCLMADPSLPGDTLLPQIEEIRIDSGWIRLSWPAQHEGFFVERNASLDPFSPWAIIPTTATVSAEQASVLLNGGGTLQFFRLRSGPEIGDFWNARAHWVPDAAQLGSQFGFHFPSIIKEGPELWAYYIRNYTKLGKPVMAVGRARSLDGKTWVDDGLVLDVGDTEQKRYESELLNFHLTGEATADGWAGDPERHSPGFLQYGPYTEDLPAGENTAVFRLQIASVTEPDQRVANIEVYNATLGEILVLKTLHVRDFQAPATYQNFDLPFEGIEGHQYEFRTYWFGSVYLQQDSITARAAAWDSRMASFPGVWKENGTFYLVYEGAGGADSRGDIGLAISTDGKNFQKYESNPLLRHGKGWESANIGTPSLFREHGNWYLFYHGFDWNRVQIGVAVGSTLTNLVKLGTPILRNDANAWDSGTLGRRSQIVRQGEYYYFAYEGSTEAPFDKARWSTGLARSTNLVEWEKFPGNPIIEQTSGGFGNDGPELLSLNGSLYLYVRTSSPTTGPTQRYRLLPK